MIRLLASDLDGTLLTGDNRLLPDTERALRAAMARGIRFLPITGRAYVLTAPFLRQYGLKTDMILSNGAEVRAADGTCLRERSIAPELLPEVTACYERHGLRPVLMTADGPAAVASREEIAASYARKRENAACDSLIPQENTARILRELRCYETVAAFLADGGRAQKIVSFSPSQADLEACRAELTPLCDRLSVVSSNAFNLEVSDREATKGAALQFYASRFGYAPEEIYVFGDQSNDISMFRFCPNSFAPENGAQEAKAAAAHIIKSNDHGGVGAVIWSLMENQKEPKEDKRK